MPTPEDYSIGELARQMRDAFVRLEGLARRLEDGHFVRTELYLLFKSNIEQALAALQATLSGLEQDKVEKSAHAALTELVKSKSDKSDIIGLEHRIGQLEDDKKWLSRLILGLIVVAVVSGALVAYGAGGKP